YVIPKQRQDSVALAALLGILHRGQVEIRTTQLPFTLGGQRFAAGSYVVVLRQPYAAFAKTLLEPQHYPDLRVSPGGPPTPPYDVTAHTLPLLMGVAAVPAPASLRGPPAVGRRGRPAPVRRGRWHAHRTQPGQPLRHGPAAPARA